MQRLILIDDEPNLLQALKRTLQRSLGSDEIRIELFDDPREALIRSCKVRVDLAISDYRMPQMNGVTFLKAFGVLQPLAMRLILSGSNDFDVVMAAINEAEIFRFLTKPWDDAELVQTVKAALERGTERAEERRLADVARLYEGSISVEEAERRILEAQIPGITQVKRWPDGSVMLEE